MGWGLKHRMETRRHSKLYMSKVRWDGVCAAMLAWGCAQAWALCRGCRGRGLKCCMEMCCHSKLYTNKLSWEPVSGSDRRAAKVPQLLLPPLSLGPPCIPQNKIKAAVVKARNSNPMRNRAATGLKAKPMPATATLLVKAVWHGYFFGAKVQSEEEEGEEEGGEALEGG